MATRKAIPEKLKKKIFQEADMTCPLCGERDVTTFEIHHIRPFSEVKKHEEENLIMLCSNCHAKATAGEIEESDLLRTKIFMMNKKRFSQKQETPQNSVEVSDSVNNGIIANSVEIKTTKKVSVNGYPPDSIGSKLDHKNYVKKLIDKYHLFKKAEMKTEMEHAVLYQTIKRNFGAKWDHIPLRRFDDLVKYLQMRIDKTILGKTQKAKGLKRYSSFEEFLEKHGS